jgi:hypothetical protein
MKFALLCRIACVAIALLVVASFSAMPAFAGGGCKGYWSKGHCYTSKTTARHVTLSGRTAKRAHAASRHAHHRTLSAHKGCRCKETRAKWHGWVASRNGEVALYHEGQRYAGGNPHGPAMWYNNYEGGFNAAVFWKLYDRNLP